MSEAASAHKPAAHDAESLTKKKNVNDGIATRPKVPKQGNKVWRPTRR